MEAQRRTPVAAGAILASLLFTSCITTGPGHRGQVVDVDTKQPIPGALVSLFQSGDEFGSIIPHGGSLGRCFHSALTMIDGDGRFSFARWRVPRRYIERYTVLFAYKPRYLIDAKSGQLVDMADVKTRLEYLNNARIAKLEKWGQQKKLNPIEYLRRDANTTRAPVDYGRGPKSLRVRYLYGKIIQEFTCGVEKTLYPLYKAVYNEAARLAVTDRDREYVREICEKGIKKHLFVRNYNPYQKPRPPCDINDVPEEWRAWDAEVNALAPKE